MPGYTIWDGASAHNAIVPNDYVVREKWADLDGVVQGIRQDHVGDLWTGSGIGPTVDGRTGIDVSAPGNSVFATLAPKSVYGIGRANKIQDGNGFYTLQNAVSGAAPQVTGIVALMLEMNPTLTAVQVKQILQQTARRDAFTGDVPNTRWGYGKVDGAAALAAVAATPGARPYYTADQNVLSADYELRAAAALSAFPVQITPSPGAPPYQITTSAAWLVTDRANGSGPSALVVTANPTGLAPGDYDGEVTIAATDSKAVPQSIMVHLHVRNPGPFITDVVDAGAFGPGFANGGFIAIRGVGLSNTTRIWTAADFQGDKLPTSLDGVQVVVFDRPAYVYYVSPTQVNVIAPDNSLTNTRFAVVVKRDGKPSNTYVANALPRNPEFFRFADGHSIAAVHLEAKNGVYVGSPDLYPTLDIKPAVPGETVLLYGTGCDPTDPPLASDRIIPATSATKVSEPWTVTIGGKPAESNFAGVVSNGPCQVNAVVPDLPSGDAEVVLTIGGYVSADGATLRSK